MKDYKDKKWIKKRLNILKRDGYLCRNCKRIGKEIGANTVHHVVPIEYAPERYLDSNNLISLCSECHNKMHNRNDGSLTTLGFEWVRRMEKNLSNGKNFIPPPD